MSTSTLPNVYLRRLEDGTTVLECENEDGWSLIHFKRSRVGTIDLHIESEPKDYVVEGHSPDDFLKTYSGSDKFEKSAEIALAVTKVHKAWTNEFLPSLLKLLQAT